MDEGGIREIKYGKADGGHLTRDFVYGFLIVVQAEYLQTRGRVLDGPG
jgi:hypothetical protein